MRFQDRTTGAICTLIRGDGMAALGALPDASFDCVLTDPPYSEHVHKNAHSVWTRYDKAAGSHYTIEQEKKPILFDALTAEGLQFIAQNVPRVSRRWGLVFCDLEAFGDYRRAAGGHSTSKGGTYVRSWVWVKGRAVPQLSGDRPGSRCEGIAVLHREGKKRWNGHGKHGYWPSEPDDLEAIDAGAVYSQITGKDRIHQTEKPQVLLGRLVDWFTDFGETILDPFAGSCSIALAALPRSRNVLCIEQDVAKVVKAAERLGRFYQFLGA